MSENYKDAILQYAELAMISHQEDSGEDQHPSQRRSNAIAIMTKMRADLGLSHEELMIEAAQFLNVKVGDD